MNGDDHARQLIDESVTALANRIVNSPPLKKVESPPFSLIKQDARRQRADCLTPASEEIVKEKATMGAALKIEQDVFQQTETRTQSRKTPRANAYLCIDLCSEHNFWTGLTMNISEGGVFVATHYILPAGSLVGLHLELPKESHRILVLGEVRWSRDYTGNDDIPPGLGIQFMGLDPKSQQAIRRFITTIREPLLFEH